MPCLRPHWSKAPGLDETKSLLSFRKQLNDTQDFYFYSVTLQHRFFSFCFRVTPTSKTKALEFHLTGESVLPHVSVLCPTMRNSAGSPMMHFRRVSVGNRHARPLVLLNNGYFPVQVSSKENSKEISSFIVFHYVEQ